MARQRAPYAGPDSALARKGPGTKRVSSLKDRQWQGQNRPQAAQRPQLQLRQAGRSHSEHHGERERQRRMKTSPVAPSFLPTDNPVLPFPGPAGQRRSRRDKNPRPPVRADHVTSHRFSPGGAGHAPSPPVRPVSPTSPPPGHPVAPATAETPQAQAFDNILFDQDQHEEAPQKDELGLPSIQELEREQRQLQHKRRKEGTEALQALEMEARSQEIERVHSSKIEVPELDLRMREGNSYLHASHLNKRYGRKIAVVDISISVCQGEVVGLLGPNGAGKTTCFYMIAGFVHPTRGQVLLDEQNISRWPMYKRARQGISYLPQEASIFRSLTVEQNLLAILEYRRDMNRRARMEMAEFLMQRLGVLRLRKQKASTLSGGERRRVEVARALVLEPRFLLLDEPFAGIDPIAVSEIKGIIRALAQSNIGILITDHNVRDTLDITDRSYIVNLGEILVSGSRAELIASKAAREVYLGAEFS